MEPATKQILDIYAKSSVGERQQIQEQVRDLHKDLYNDWEMMLGLAVAISVSSILACQRLTTSWPVQCALVDVGIDLDIFTSLTFSTAPITHSEFQKRTKTAPNLLSHVFRSMASFGLIAEVSKDNFATNRTTRAFANPHITGTVLRASNSHLLVMQAVPSYLVERKYQDILVLGSVAS